VDLMRDDLSKEARRLWLFLRDQGGWWTPGELGNRLFDEQYPLAASAAGRHLRPLRERGHVVHRQGRRIRQFGVTAKCMPIPGETLEPSATVKDRS
jgi:hypothetical protein